MTEVLTPSRSSSPSPATAMPHEWMSPERMRRYQRSKMIGAILISSIFMGWMWLQWSNPTMRFLSMAFVGATAWITGSSILADRARVKGRSLQLNRDYLKIITPQSKQQIALEMIGSARWCDDEPADQQGLWLFDRQGKQLTHLDTHFLESQEEARAFLGWARKRANLTFNVQWPATTI